MWDQRYAEPEFAYGTEPNDFVAERAARIPEGPVLCLAEGQGRNAVFLAERGHEVVAVDQSAVGLERAQELAARRGVRIETVCADLAELVIEPGHWAGVVSIWCHVPPALRARLHRDVVAGLRPGGVLLLESYTPAQLALGTGGPPVVELMMTLAGLREELAGLDFEHAVEIERFVEEGRYHRGNSAVVQVVGVKPG